MRYLKGRCISIVSEPVHVVQADGELIGQTPMDFEVAPQAASFLVPR
jgi:diacylglycerol kinase family enzyme